MRRGLTTTLALAAIIGGGAFGQSARRILPVRASTRLQLIAELDKTNAKEGVPVFINLHLKNISPAVVKLGGSDGYVDYELKVVDGSGKEAQRTEYGLAEHSILYASSVDLEPGQEDKTTLELTKVYVLPPGKYYARADRKAIWGTVEEYHTFEEKAFSNPVEFTITP